mgnify:CR=1 FL=1
MSFGRRTTVAVAAGGRHALLRFIILMLWLMPAPTIVGALGPSPVNCTGNEHIKGYTSYQHLKIAIESAEITENNPKTFILCPDTILRLDGASSPTITLDTILGVTIQCGVNGNPSDSCVIQGGAQQQLSVIGEGAELKGVTFRGAKHSGAVDVEKPDWLRSPGATIFDRCIFEYNQVAGAFSQSGAAVTVHAGSTAVFRDCVFRRNVSWLGAVFVSSGSAMFIRCTFERNAFLGPPQGAFFGSPSISVSDGFVLVQETFFLENKRSYPQVYLLGSSVIGDNRGNLVFSDDNDCDSGSYSDTGGSQCSGIYQNETLNCFRFDLTCEAPSSSPGDMPSQTAAPSPSSISGAASIPATEEETLLLSSGTVMKSTISRALSCWAVLAYFVNTFL